MKLAKELSKVATGRTLYILDEPTTGLHFADIEKLLEVLQRLVDAGNTVLVIEHNLDVIKQADWIVDLGPEGGEAGGEIVAAGTPEEVARGRGLVTGQFLRDVLPAAAAAAAAGRDRTAAGQGFAVPGGSRRAPRDGFARSRVGGKPRSAPGRTVTSSSERVRLGDRPRPAAFPDVSLRLRPMQPAVQAGPAGQARVMTQRPCPREDTRPTLTDVSAHSEARRSVAEKMWWLRTVTVLVSPRAVFQALRDDGQDEIDARQEPVLAILILAGISGVLATSAARHLLDDFEFDAILIPVWAFIAGLIYGIACYWIAGAAHDVGCAAAGSAGTYRRARHLLALAAAPWSWRWFVVWPVRIAIYRRCYLFRSGRQRHRTGGISSSTIRDRAVLSRGRLALLAIGVPQRARVGLGDGPLRGHGARSPVASVFWPALAAQPGRFS